MASLGRRVFQPELADAGRFHTCGNGGRDSAFLWPLGGSSAGFGGKIAVTGLSRILVQIDQKHAPFYVPRGEDLAPALPGVSAAESREGLQARGGRGNGTWCRPALYQRCPHLGCRVPWCQTSQWFECPCHGSKYNAVGEKKAGPTPRGMDRFAIAFNGDNITIDTQAVILGPPVGTNTTGQNAAGPPCV